MIDMLTPYIGFIVMAVVFTAFIYIVYAFLNPKERKTDNTLYDMSLEKLAHKYAWVKRSEEEIEMGVQVHDVRTMSSNWREPSTIFDPEYLPKLNQTGSSEFFNEFISTTPYFQKTPYHRGVCVQLLEKLDHEYPCSSVVKAHRDDDNDKAWDSQSYNALSKVPLMDHAIHVAGRVANTLIEKGYPWMIPNAMIAALAHDISKLRSLHEAIPYKSLTHPDASIKILNEINGYQKVAGHQEIEEAITKHHTDLGKSYLAKLLRDSDKEVRKEEFLAQVDIEKISEPPAWVCPEYYDNLQIEELKEQVSKIVVISPGIKQPDNKEQSTNPQKLEEYDVVSQLPTDEETLLDENQVDSENVDAKWQEAIRWLNETDLGIYSVNTLKDHLRVGRGRAEILFNALIENGYLSLGDERKISEAEQEAVTEATERVEEQVETTKKAPKIVAGEQPEKGVLSPAATINTEAPVKEPTLVEPQQAKLFTDDSADLVDIHNLAGIEAPDNEYGTMTVFDSPVEPPEKSTFTLLDISYWFDQDGFIRLLKERLNVDMRKAKERKHRDVSFFQGVTTRKGIAYFRIQAIKDIAAHQLIHNAKEQDAAESMLGRSQGDTDIQQIVMQAIVKKFVDNNLVDTSYLKPGFYSVRCTIEQTTGSQDNQYFIPFFAKTFGNLDDLEKIKKGQTLVSQIKNIIPSACIEARKEAM